MSLPFARLPLHLLACSLLTSLPATASEVQQNPELNALRQEIAQLKQSYEHRIKALEQRLGQAEASATPAATPPRSNDRPASAVNPEIGLILQGRATRRADLPEPTLTGFWAAGHEHGQKRGLSLDHSELILTANIDPRWRGVARFALDADGEMEVEEASISSLGLGHGLTLRGGRFASDFGYQNARHPHQWDFADATLMQQALFGKEGYRQDGLQLKWIAPTDFLLQLGAEIGRGAGFPGTERNGNGAGARTLFAKTGGDVGESHAWQAGLSLLGMRAQERGEQHLEDVDGAETEAFFSGKSRTASADFVWKWAPNGNARDQNLTLQSEVFRRDERGSLHCEDADAASHCSGGRALGDWRSRQSGGYAQTVWQFMPHWRVGYRYDWLNPGRRTFDEATVFATLDAANAFFSDFKPRRHSLMLDWSPSEFSRLRLQLARDQSMQGSSDEQLTLQYIMSLGAHGAHRF